MKLNLIEIFRSVQGETNLSGLPTTFIRLAACNLRCTWCDTSYSFGRGSPYEFSTIIDTVQKNGCKYVCITGGEPLLQPSVHSLMKELCDLGYVVSLETSGSLSTKDVPNKVITILDVKCPGSGMESKNDWSNMELLKPHDQIKFVIADRIDYEYAKEIMEKYDLIAKVDEVLLSPVFEQLEAKQLVEWILEDKLLVRLNLQTHKFIWHPQTQGV